jgi:hypothetical protein
MSKLVVHCSVVVALATVAYTPSSRAQNVAQFLGAGDAGGIGAYGAFATNDAAKVLGVFGTYGMNASVDVGLGLLYYSFDEDDFGGAEVSAYGIAPGANAILLRQGASSPVSVGVGGSFQYQIFSSSDLDDAGVDVSGWSVQGGGAVYRDVALGASALAKPQAGLQVVHASVTVDSALGDTTESDDIFQIALHGNIAIPGARTWVIDPFLIVDLNEGDDESSETTFGVAVGVVMPR